MFPQEFLSPTKKIPSREKKCEAMEKLFDLYRICVRKKARAKAIERKRA